ncbi:hypothetical protein Tco_1538972 [Tanacetum coccineum]
MLKPKTARINADKILAEELQKEEREKFTIEQRAKFLHDTIAVQRKFLAQQKKHSDLKTQTFEEIQVLYERLKGQDQNFVAIGSTEDERQIKELNKDPKKKRVSSPDGNYLVVYRVNGYFRAFNYLMEVLHIFDRHDLFHLYDLVMKQYSEITPEYIELILWGDLKIMMESSTEEISGDFWKLSTRMGDCEMGLYEAVALHTELGWDSHLHAS